MKKFLLFLLTLALAYHALGLEFKIILFEDGSGRVTMTYCLPFTLCTLGE